MPATAFLVGLPAVQTELIPDGAWPLVLLEANAAGSTGPAPPKPPPTETIAIVVNSALSSSVSAQVAQYRQDLNKSGYNTILYTSLISTHQQLKGNLTQWYTSNGLVGAVFIGRLPYAQYYHPASTNFAAEAFICDLYLMDLDGSWWDINPADGIYDKHNATAPADIYPEIFVSRIDPSCLSWDTPANFVNAYLSRVHTYRTGGVQRQRRALVYIDNDWVGYWGTRWAGDVSRAYSTQTLVDFPTSWTNATDWQINRLTQDYQWTHICVHSNPTTHYFGPSGSGEGTLNSTQVRAVPPAFNFYNLFACSGARWTVTDDLAVTYVMSSSYGLAAVGSTKTGGMMDCNYFYDSLGNNFTLGESLAKWFSLALNSGSSALAEYLEWYYGINLVGDPFLSIYYDCTVLPPIITSSTHPDSSQWYTNTLPQFNWTTPVDVNGVNGFFFVIDKNPFTLPTRTTGTFTRFNGTVPAAPLTNGTWYLHVVANDSVGNIGSTPAHYQVNVKVTITTTPTIPPIPGFPLEGLAIGLVIGIMVALSLRRRRAT